MFWRQKGMLPQFIIAATGTYGKYITQDWKKIKQLDFLNARVDYFDKIIKLIGCISCVIAVLVVFC